MIDKWTTSEFLSILSEVEEEVGHSDYIDKIRDRVMDEPEKVYAEQDVSKIPFTCIICCTPLDTTGPLDPNHVTCSKCGAEHLILGYPARVEMAP